jgi:transposase
MPRPRKYPEELLQRGVRLALESGRPIAQVARDLGMHPETLRRHVRQAQADAGDRRDLLSSEEREEIRRLRSENFGSPWMIVGLRRVMRARVGV